MNTNIGNVFSGLGAVVGGIAGGYKDPSIGLEMFLAQRKAEDERAYRQMRLDATLWSKGLDRITDEDEIKTLLSNRKNNPSANKGYLDLGGSMFYKLNPDRVKSKTNTSLVNGEIAKAQEKAQYRQAVQNAIAQNAPLTEIKAGIAKGGFMLKDFADIVVPYAGGLNKMPPQPNMKQLFMQNVGNMIGTIIPKDNFKKVMTK